MPKTSTTWTQNMIRNANVEKNGEKGKLREEEL
jgi:hypothetical protein